MFSNLSDNIKAIILALIGFTAFSIADVNAKLLTQHYSVVQIVGTIGIFATALSVIMGPWLGGFKRTVKTRKLKIHIARALCNTGVAVFIVLAFSQLSMALVYTLVFAAPFITSLLAIPIFKERIDAHGWIAIIGGFAGVLIVLRPGAAPLDIWLLTPIMAALFVAGMFILSRMLTEEETLLSLTLYPNISHLIFLAPLVFIWYEFPALEHMWQFGVQGVMQIIGLCCIALAFRIGKTSIVSPIHYVQLILAVIFGYTIFGDVPDIWTIIGGLVIIASGLYLIHKERMVKYTADHI